MNINRLKCVSPSRLIAFVTIPKFLEKLMRFSKTICHHFKCSQRKNEFLQSVFVVEDRVLFQDKWKAVKTNNNFFDYMLKKNQNMCENERLMLFKIKVL